MEFRIIENKTFERLKQSLSDLLKQSEDLKANVLQGKWLDNQDVCQLLGISLRTLQSYRDKSLIPYSMVEHKCYYKTKDIQAFIEKNKINLQKNK